MGHPLKNTFLLEDEHRLTGPMAFNLMIKPAGSLCNLDCSYCYYLDKADIYGGRQPVMSIEMLETVIREYIRANDVPDVTFNWHGGEPLVVGLDFYRKAIGFQKKYADGKNIETRENMLKASYYAGMAFTRAYVGYVHAIAHNLGGMYGIPHGLANAVILPYILEFFGDSAHHRLAILADVAGITDGLKTEKEKAEKFIEAIKELNRKMNIPDKFEGIKDEDIELIAKIEEFKNEGCTLFK